MSKNTILKTYDVSVQQVTENSGNQLSDTFYHNCLFCEKLVKVSSTNFKSCLNLGGGKFYCPFCLRNNFHYRSSRNVLIFSFRSIIGQYYYKHFLEAQGRTKMWVSEIRSLIKNHERVGLKCPVLFYDPTTYLWFADFNKIGKDVRKAPIEEVTEAIALTLQEFQLDKIYGSYAFNGIWDKYNKALKLFYAKRQRPVDRRMLIPTMHGIVHGYKDNFFDGTRDFIPVLLDTK